MRSTTDDAASLRSGEDRGFAGHPRALGPLFFTEMWERFSYYGIRPLLVLFMAATVFEGGLGFSRETASAIVGIYAGAVYLSALPGGWLADNWLGQRRAVWYGSVLIALGHLSIAFSAVWGATWFFIGLVLIVLGSGLFKSCISVMVGSLYDQGDVRRDGGFAIFYMGINIGGLMAPLFTGLLMREYGWHWGFGIGGLGMLLALLIFRLSAIPAMRRADSLRGRAASWDAPAVHRRGVGYYVAALAVACAVFIALVANGAIVLDAVAIAEAMTTVIIVCALGYFVYLFAFSGLDKQERARIVVCFILIMAAAFFWASFEQQPTSYNLFAHDYTDRMLFGWEVPAVWFQSFNPVFIILLGPLFGWLWPALGRRRLEPGSPVKFVLGLLFAAGGFALMMLAAMRVAGGAAQVSPLWITGSLLLLTIGELCLSPVGLSTMSALAPVKLRGQLMGLWFTASALGNLVAGLIGGHVNAEELEQLPELFARCAVALVACAVLLALLTPVIKRMLKGNPTVDPAGADASAQTNTGA
ncbi:peptide MFS transporter [Chromohalobacter israelensis]|uniref:peptide MFS transporter n=1 Tax=Chromohalobacter israelensis TaxID=141390 RepID=UPI000D7092B5|nr:peptide MFS transporter [Chromohalobacter salexigens]MBZ5876506.1 peptide MFS transporter [Chromohalobacter salexigens]MDO0946132.1 peptide MFS transporter [Chromohalobacter salexigens]NWO56457.1 MFS transporter [Chromohalobacter salexigens]PWW35403.1 POT family proton-dependent oligopeptide transporter [Chromohalobacter salexigens]